MKRVEVEWLDSVCLQNGGGDDADEFRTELRRECLTHVSVGWLLAENELGVLLIQSWYEPNERGAGALIIPRGAIVAMRELAPTPG